uniref:Secreted protein n=1 Tax=Gopherus agassizii TaxID=38772 RepID=A0A452J1L2_9SAUR
MLTVHCLLEAVAVALGLHVQREIAVGGDLVGAQRVGAQVRVEGALQWEAGARCGALGDLHCQVGLREGGRIVIDVQHLDLHPEQLEGVLQKDLQVQLAGGGVLLADLLPVDLLVHVRAPRVGYRLEAASRKFCNVQAQVLGDIPHEHAMLLLLLHRVVKLRKESERKDT